MAGFIYDHSIHYIDHLAPFCALLKRPLFIREESIAQLCRQYYPDLEVIETDSLPSFPFITCDTKAFLRAAFPFQPIPKTFWLPHGMSDKGWKSRCFAALQEEETVLVYGQKMRDDMATQGIFLPSIQIGNFRLAYFQKYATFYQTFLTEKWFEQKTFLYAPTWDDSEENGSFWHAFPKLAKTLPDHYNLLVKLHPNLRHQHPDKLESFMGRYQRENIFFLPEIPPIYPILSKCDVYIGDMSSVGYDFLTFGKPMFFINMTGRDHPLFQCGTEIDLETFDFHIPSFLPNQQLLHYTFASNPNWNKLCDMLR